MLVRGVDVRFHGGNEGRIDFSCVDTRLSPQRKKRLISSQKARLKRESNNNKNAHLPTHLGFLPVTVASKKQQ